MTPFDVAILGYGPTGATLANLLAARGVRVLVLDREAAAYHLPRAVHFDDEVMRVFQTVGIADDLSARVHVNPGMKFVDAGGGLLMDWPRPQDITHHGWHASYRLHQPDLEELLRNRLARSETATIETGIDIVAIADRGDHVHLDGHDRTTGRARRFQTRYLVGCDGANSLTREVIGGGMDDLGFEERWLVIDVILKRPRPDLGDHSVQFCDPVRPMTYCRSPGDRRRWEITVRPGENDAEITAPERVWQFLSRWITPDDATLERRAVYTFRSRVARRWRRGNMMIAGDAAHLTPPFMGQGMCTGIRDAANLAWKLAATVDGADPALLDSYQAERAPHARAYVETAMRLGGLINALDRNAALRLAETDGEDQTRMRSISPSLGPSRLLALGDAPDVVGRPFGQIDLGAGARAFDDRIGHAHAILADKAVAGMVPDVIQLTTTDHPALSGALQEIGAGAVWLRPDRYVGAVADSPAALVEKLPGFLKTAPAG